MSLSKMASTTNPSMKDDVSSQDGDAVTESICDLDDDEEKCVNITNTVLAYVQYGISSASPDNVLEVVCTHFTLDEIAEAKDILYDLGDPPIRNKHEKLQRHILATYLMRCINLTKNNLYFLWKLMVLQDYLA